jgi:hypothetical protein
MKKLVILALFLSLGMILKAQSNQDVVLRVEMQYDTVGLNEAFSVTYVVENAQNAQIAAPAFDGFHRLGSSQSMRTNIVNGQMSSSVSYTYNLKPTALGYYNIPAATVYVGSDTYQTPDAAVIVVESTNHRPPVASSPFGFGNSPSFGFNDQDLDDLFKRQEQLMRPYQDMFNVPMDSLLQNPNQMFKSFGLGEDMMQMFKNFEDIFEFKMPPLEKKKPEEKTYKL